MLDSNNHFSLRIQVISSWLNFLLLKDSISAFPWKPQFHVLCKNMTGTADKTEPKGRNLKNI